MISYNYNISEFADFVKSNGNIFELIKIAEDEVYQAERMVTPGRRGAPKEREKECYEYIREIKGFLFFLRSGSRPTGARCFDLFRPVCQNLIDKKVFKPEAINAFLNNTR